MDYEKLYNEALKRAKGICNVPDQDDITIARMEYLFPELKESEDEKIRKSLIRVLNENVGNGIEKYGAKLEDVLAWLEKQGQEPKKVSIWKHWKNGIAGNGEGEPIYLIKEGGTYNLSSCLSFECDYIELSELDNLMLEKQKSVGEIVERCKNSWYNEGKIAGMLEGLTDDEKYQQGWHDALEEQGEQKPTWSEEDESLLKWTNGNLTELKEQFGEKYGKVGECISWLKSLKERLS